MISQDFEQNLLCILERIAEALELANELKAMELGEDVAEPSVEVATLD